MRHTPGPWTVLDTKKIIRDADSNDVCIVLARDFSLEGTVGQIYTSDIRVHNAVANAKLIAAAPEMYAALELILNDNRLMNAMSKEQAKAIMYSLAKARGES